MVHGRLGPCADGLLIGAGCFSIISSVAWGGMNRMEFFECQD